MWICRGRKDSKSVLKERHRLPEFSGKVLFCFHVKLEMAWEQKVSTSEYPQRHEYDLTLPLCAASSRNTGSFVLCVCFFVCFFLIEHACPVNTRATVRFWAEMSWRHSSAFFFCSYLLDRPHQLQKPEVQYTANGFFVFKKNITDEFSFVLF